MGSPAVPSGPRRRVPRAVCLGGALAVLVVASTGHRFANDFVFDDQDVIAAGSVIHDPGQLGAVWTHHTMYASSSDPGRVQSVDTYRPLTITLFMVDAQLSGRATWAYHLTNLLLHLGCVWLVFAVARRLLGSGADWAAFYGAAVFALHPWAVEAHVWINGRSDPAALLFGLAGFLLLLRADGAFRAPGRRTAAALLLLAGLLSKETLLTVFPALALAPAPAGSAAPLRTRLWRRMWPLAFAACCYLGLRAWVLSGLATHRDGAMLSEAASHLPWLLFDGLRQALVPSLPYLRSLRDEYATLSTWQLTLAGFGLAAVALLAWRVRRRLPITAWSVLWFFSPLVPIAVLTTVLWPGFGRYLYLPLAGLAWALAEVGIALCARVSRPRLLSAAGAVHVASLALLAALATRDFRDSEALYGAAIDARPDVAMGHGWLGLARRRTGDHEGAAAALLRASELDPETHRYLIHAGRELLALGERRRAAAVAAEGLRRFAGRPEAAAYHLLAVNAMEHSDPERAVHHLAACLEAWPGREDCTTALRLLLHAHRDAPANRAALRRFLEARPDRRTDLAEFLDADGS
jgi:hypothetical protein